MKSHQMLWSWGRSKMWNVCSLQGRRNKLVMKMVVFVGATYWKVLVNKKTDWILKGSWQAWKATHHNAIQRELPGQHLGSQRRRLYTPAGHYGVWIAARGDPAGRHCHHRSVHWQVSETRTPSLLDSVAASFTQFYNKINSNK